MTPILCLWGIISLSSKKKKKSYILCKLGYTLILEPHPIYSQKSVFTIVFTKALLTIFADITPILCFWVIILLYPFPANKNYLLCKLGYTLNSEAPPHIIVRKSLTYSVNWDIPLIVEPPPHIYHPKPVFTIVFTKTLHTFLLI